MLKKYSLKQILLSLIVFLLFHSFCISQTITNLELLYSLTDSLSNRILNEIPPVQEEIVLILNLGESYPVFANNIKSSFIKSGKKILESPPGEQNIPYVDIVIEGAGIEYGEMFKDGWFGSHFIQRYALLSGSYMHAFSGEGKRNFSFELADTVRVDDIEFLENESFPFTKSDLPPEPFLSGWAEPLIAIGTAAVIVALFFSVRSE